MDQADCDGDGSAGSGWSLAKVGLALLPPNTAIVSTHNGFLSNYSVEFVSTSGPVGASYGSSIYTGGNCTPGSSTLCPYYNQAGTGLNLQGLNGGPYFWQNLSSSSIARPAESMFVGEGTTNMYTRSPVARILIALGCEGQFRHKSTGSNYTFHDGHSKYLGTNMENIQDKDSSGAFYIKYMSYDK